MFVQTSSTVQKRPTASSTSSNSSSNNNNNKHQSAPVDELMFDLEDISRLCETRKTTEVQELALDVVSKMVESWLDPINMAQEAQCSCATDVTEHIGQFSLKGNSKNNTGPNLDVNNGYQQQQQQPAGNNGCQKMSEKRLVQDGIGGGSFDGTIGNSNEKRPRCNTGDKTASRSPGDYPESTADGNKTVGKVQDEYFDLVALHLPIILRLCFACPFGKVREKSRGILKSIRDKGLPVPVPLVFGPSDFIPSSELSFMGTCNEKTHTFFADTFLQNNRLDHATQVMGYHPSYMEKFLQTQNFILKGDGPLPFVYRHYIAIMAAGRHQCSYIIGLQKQEFLQQGGDQNWLRGLTCIPQKLRNLYDINKILAHRPWLLTTSHIEKLLKCGSDSWSLAEVVHAIVILTHFHSLCSYVFSCGVNQELDQASGFTFPTDHRQRDCVENDAEGGVVAVNQECCESAHHENNRSRPHLHDLDIVVVRENKTEAEGVVVIEEGANSGVEDWVDPGACPPSPTEPEVGIVTLMQRMKTLAEQTKECTPVELAKRFENIEVQSAELGVVGPEPQETPADISYFIDDPGFQYQDFAKRSETDVHTFRVQDFSWDDHGYSTVNRLYNDVGTLLDSKFRTAYNLTYYTMGGRKHVDTSKFRRAIWNYIQALLGIRHDDYDYGEINALVEKSLKSFIKTACCYPERVTKKVYDRVMREFKHSEKVHVNLMVLESRMQAELVYALNIVNRYMTK